jgi:hypothetical protein
VDGRGTEHRKEVLGRTSTAGSQFYLWLIRNGFPDGFQTLCMPCNQSKAKGARCRIDHAAIRKAAADITDADGALS